MWSRKCPKKYLEDLLIISLLDAGFYDSELFEEFENPKIGYLCSDNKYRNVLNDAIDIFDWLRQHKQMRVRKTACSLRQSLLPAFPFCVQD